MMICCGPNCRQGRGHCSIDWCYEVGDEEVDAMIEHRIIVVLAFYVIAGSCAAAWSIWGGA